MGAVLQTDGKQLIPVIGFLPITDLKQLIEVAKANPQMAEAIKLNGDVYEIRGPQKTLYATQKDKWTIVTDKAENLAKAPADPLKLLGDLPERYLVAVRASIQNLPKEYRDQALAQLHAIAEAGAAQMPREGNEDAGQLLNKQMKALVDDTEDVVLGWNTDAKANTTYLDLETTAKAGSKLAEQFAAMKPGKTKFAGLLLPGAAVTVNSIGTLNDAQVAQIKAAVASMRESLPKELEKQQRLSPDQVKLASQFLGQVLDAIQRTAEAKQTDAGLALVLDPAAVTLVAGSTIVDGAKLETAVQQLNDELQKDADLAKSIKLGAESYQGMHLHSVSVPTPDPKLVPIFGETLDAVLAIANDKVLVAVGRDASKTLKQVIENSSSGVEVPPLQIRLSAMRIAKFVAQVAEDEQAKGTAQMVAKLLEKNPGKDHLTITANPITRGVRVRLELEEGLIKAIGTLGQAMSGMPVGGPSP